MKTWNQSAGLSAPLGATVLPHGVNFSVFSKHATAIELLLFDDVQAAQPSRVVRLEEADNRTYHYWHVFVPDLRPGQVYAYRAHGPFAPERGWRYRPRQGVDRPVRTRGVAVPGHYSRHAAEVPGDNVSTAMKSVVADPGAYDWEGDRPLGCRSRRTVIYEMHVGGFTRHPSSGVAAGKTRNLRGIDREDAVPQGARDHGGRAAAGPPVRPAVDCPTD